MTALQHLLCKLAEEGSEVAQRALKTAYFGLDEIYQGKTNREMLHDELNDLLGVMEMLNDMGLDFTPSESAVTAKQAKVREYLAYSQRLGMTEKEEVQVELPPAPDVVPVKIELETPKISFKLSQRGRDWQEFAAKVLNHIENYTVPQYGDAPNDLAETWTPRQSLDCVDRYSRRYGKNSRDGQQELDFLKMAHYIQLAALKHGREVSA